MSAGAAHSLVLAAHSPQDIARMKTEQPDRYCSILEKRARVQKNDHMERRKFRQQTAAKQRQKKYRVDGPPLERPPCTRPTSATPTVAAAGKPRPSTGTTERRRPQTARTVRKTRSLELDQNRRPKIDEYLLPSTSTCIQSHEQDNHHEKSNQLFVRNVPRDECVFRQSTNGARRRRPVRPDRQPQQLNLNRAGGGGRPRRLFSIRWDR